MSMAQIAVLLVSAAIVVTKFIDCWTTAKHLGGPEAEMNPFIRSQMERIGFHRVIWVVFGLVVAIAAIVGSSAYVAATDGPSRSLPTAGGVRACRRARAGVSVVYAAVAQTNYSGKFNAITRPVLALILWLRRCIQRARERDAEC